ncbi:MAG: hypothetical protein WEB59_00010 [Thermoanaerobaculia bacterium]
MTSLAPEFGAAHAVPLGFAYADRTVRFEVDLPPHAVAAVTLELASEPSESRANSPGGDGL